MLLRTRAPAKINLTLHIMRRRPDGYHELESLVAFAGVADILELEAGGALALEVDGPTAQASGDLGDNLVLRAARALADRIPGLELGRFRLTKRLPVGAGIGGGSSDAAAAFRLLAQMNGIELGDERLHEAARTIGADVPVCLEPRSKMMGGTGDRLGPRLPVPSLFAVLVNPGIHLETRAVFRTMGLEPGQAGPSHAHTAPGEEDLDQDTLLRAVARGRNDMELAAGELAPVIPDVLAALSLTRDCRLARMSGSGSTCFGLFASRASARHAAAALRQNHPRWWVRATPLA